MSITTYYDTKLPRELRLLSALNDSKQHTHEAREVLYPLVMRAAARARHPDLRFGVWRTGRGKRQQAAVWREIVIVIAHVVAGAERQPVGDQRLAAVRPQCRGLSAQGP